MIYNLKKKITKHDNAWAQHKNIYKQILKRIIPKYSKYSNNETVLYTQSNQRVGDSLWLDKNNSISC